ARSARARAVRPDRLGDPGRRHGVEPPLVPAGPMTHVCLRAFGLLGLASAAFVPLAPVVLDAQAPAQTGARAAGTTTSDAVTTAVLVDVVVRDRRGRPVTDLTAGDFELREDGTVQEVGSFTRVAR